MKSVSFIIMCLAACAAHGQLFTELPAGPAVEPAWAVAGPRPVRGAVMHVEVAQLRASLADAPIQRLDASLHTYGARLTLPAPDGAMIECFVAESPVMEPELQAKFPAIRTYIVQSVDQTASGRLEISPRGLTAMLRRVTDGTENTSVWMIDPWRSGDAEHVVSYWLADLPGGTEWTCHTAPGDVGHVVEEDEGQEHVRAMQTLRTARIAVACTGEYGVHQSVIQGHEPNVDDPMAAIVTVVGRTNVVYEADLAVHFNLVANNDRIVFFDPKTDPYPTTCDGTGGQDCSFDYLARNIDTLHLLIGSANFDVGHLMTRVYGGVAYLRSVCGPNKAGGISGIPRGGDIDPFAAQVVVHELGHQFGANHTFSGTRGRCGNNANLLTAWEAGSGSSPMAYAGACPVGDETPSDNVARFADPFFHVGSIGEMRDFLQTGSLCLVQTSTANNIPNITSQTPNTLIPPSTPFVLTAAAVDADEGTVLTYSWEQFDSGVRRPLTGEGSADNGLGALFRIFPPAAASSRTFPRMADLLAGEPTPGERLPTVLGAIRRFRVIVRDNHPGAGATASSTQVNVTIAPNTSAFAVLTPAAGAKLDAGEHQVTWSTGNTQNPPVVCSSVTLLLSTDDGASFEQTLGIFPNTGSATVTLPPGEAAARIRINANGKIFFAMSGPFTIDASCAADFNRDDTVDSQDFFDFLAAFFKSAKSADFNQDGFVDSQDFFDFLGVFFAGC